MRLVALILCSALALSYHALAMEQMMDTEQAQEWLDAILDPTSERIGMAGAVLAEMDPSDAMVPALLQIAADGTKAQRSAALQVVGAWGRREALERVREIAAAHPAEVVPLLCRGRLGDAEALPAIAGLLDHDDPFVQGDAVWILGERGAVAHAPAIAGLLLGDALPMCGGEAIVTLGKLRHRAARDRLIELLHSEAAGQVCYVWVDARGAVNDERPCWQLIAGALRLIDAVAAESPEALDSAREQWPNR